MDLGLTGRTYVLTAASSGLGRAVATQLVEEGAKVVLVARRSVVLAEAWLTSALITPLRSPPI